jgi:hypothetical protein
MNTSRKRMFNCLSAVHKFNSRPTAYGRLTLPLDLNLVTELTGLSLYLDSVVEELLESRRVKDIVGCWDRVVDVEFVDWLGSGFGGGLLGL